MSRLTKKVETRYIITCPNLLKYIDGKNQSNEFLFAQDKGIQKLGQLEDIEEDLGIDLITLFKALKSTDGIWVNCEHVPQLQSLLAACKEPGQKIFRYPYSPEIGYFEDRETKEQHFGFKIYNYFISIKDYGKAWAFAKNELTKENAENENEKVGIACLSKDQQNEIKELFKNGSSLQELAEKYNVRRTTILKVIKTLFKEE